jgi:elongation factor 1 alpha-like protein
LLLLLLNTVFLACQSKILLACSHFFVPHHQYDDYDDYGAAPQPAKPKKQQSAPPKKLPVIKKKNSQSVAVATVAPTNVQTPNQLKTQPVIHTATTQPRMPSAVPSQTATQHMPQQQQVTRPTPAILQQQIQNNNKNDKRNLTLVILGHVDAGKSTVAGHLLYATQQQQSTAAAASTSKQQQRNNNTTTTTNYAWLLDEDAKERQHGVTMDIGTKQIATKNYKIVLQDAPGHADYIPAMITGTASADACLLVVDASDFVIQKEHALLARGLGVRHALVVVNKMDAVDWDQSVFLKIQQEMQVFLQAVGYANARYCPVSGLMGTNIVTKPSSDTVDWYKGQTLLEALDGFAAAPMQQQLKVLEKPLRIVLTDVMGEQGRGGVAVRGKVVQGWVQTSDVLVVLPIGDEASLQKLASLQASENKERRNYAVAGETIDFVLNGIDVMRVAIGNVLALPNCRPPMATKCRVRVWILDGLVIPIIRGAQALFHMHHLDIPCYMSNLTRTLKKDGVTTLKERPRVLTSNTQAIVELTLSVPIVMEAFTDCRSLGRFVLRRSGASIAVGRIEEVLP